MNNRKSVTLPIECWRVILSILKVELYDIKKITYVNNQTNEDHHKMLIFLNNIIDEITNQVG